MKHTAYKTFYKTARCNESGTVYAVVAQDAESKDDVKHLLLKRPHGNVWHKIETLSPCL